MPLPAAELAPTILDTEGKSVKVFVSVHDSTLPNGLRDTQRNPSCTLARGITVDGRLWQLPERQLFPGNTCSYIARESYNGSGCASISSIQTPANRSAIQCACLHWDLASAATQTLLQMGMIGLETSSGCISAFQRRPNASTLFTLSPRPLPLPVRTGQEPHPSRFHDPTAKTSKTPSVRQSEGAHESLPSCEHRRNHLTWQCSSSNIEQRRRACFIQHGAPLP